MWSAQRQASCIGGICKLVLLWCFFIGVCLASWTTLSDGPAASGLGALVLVGSDLLYFSSTKTLCYSIDTDLWTLVNQRPTASDYVAAATTSPGTAVAIGGYIRPQDVSQVEEVDVRTGTWRSLASQPEARNAQAGVSAGGSVFAVGAARISTVTNEIWEYKIQTDGWTTRAPIPTARQTVSAASMDGSIVVFGGKDGSPLQLVESYSIASDAWKTVTQMPNARGDMSSMAAAAHEAIYVVGGLPAPTSGILHRYFVLTDTWAVDSSHPITNAHQGGGAVFYSINSRFYLFSKNTKLHSFQTPFAALIGDPVVTTFEGTRHHLHLYPAVFNLLSTPHVTINAALEVLPSLPMDENCVMTLVGIVAHFDDEVTLQVDCSVQREHDAFVCTVNYGKETASSTHDTAVQMNHTAANVAYGAHLLTLHVPGFYVKVHQVTHHVLAVWENRMYAASWLNVHVFPTSTTTGDVSGLFFDLPGLETSMDISSYEIENGNIFSPPRGLE